MSDSNIQFKSPNGWKFKAAFGGIGLVVIVILAFLYRVEFGIVVLVAGLGGAALIWAKAARQYRLDKFEQRRLEAETAKAEAEAVHAKASSFFIEMNTGTFVLEGIAIDSFYPAVTASKTLADVPMLANPESPKIRKLLDIEFVHMLLIGPSGSGKSTVACHLIDNAPYDATVYVLDPHKSQNENKGLFWPNRSIVVGDGRDWAAIDRKMIDLMSEMNTRYQPGATFKPLYIICDEWLTTRDACPHANDFFEKLGSEARKVDMRLVIATISHTVDDLKCSAPVRDNLIQLRLDTALKEQNRGELKYGKSSSTTELVELPGRYSPRYRLPAKIEPEEVPEVEEDIPELDSGPVAYMPTSEELKIYELHEQGKTLHAIYKELYPDRTYGGNQAKELEAVLAKFGVNL